MNFPLKFQPVKLYKQFRQWLKIDLKLSRKGLILVFAPMSVILVIMSILVYLLNEAEYDVEYSIALLPVAELAIVETVSAIACARAGIHCGDERIWVEPLHSTRLGDAGNRVVLIERYTGNRACELRPAAVDNPIAIRGIRRTQNRERNPAVPKDGSRHLPATQRIGQVSILKLQRELIDVLRVEIVADVVVTGTIVAR